MSGQSRRPGRPSRGRSAGERWSRAPAPIPCRRGLSLFEPDPELRPILIVDDDDFGREALGRILETGGYHVQRAAGGDEALRLAACRRRPGLVVLDLVMPGLDGWEFVRRQQGDPRLAGIPVIVVSAEDATPLREEFVGVVASFRKPVAVRDLLSAIRRHLTVG